MGLVGLMGPMGLVGLMGPMGLVGLMGPMGLVGLMGPMGLMGLMGLVGLVGLMGRMPTIREAFSPIICETCDASPFITTTSASINSSSDPRTPVTLFPSHSMLSTRESRSNSTPRSLANSTRLSTIRYRPPLTYQPPNAYSMKGMI